MSLLIKGMDMPKDCLLCPCCVGEGTGMGRQHYCQAIDDEPYVSENYRPDNCSISEIPTPHGRLIDEVQVQKIIEDFVRGWCQDTKNDFNKYRDYAGVFVGLIKQAPTIIEAEE